MLLRDMDRAVIVIRRAIDEGKKILIFGDYDCDGITATVLLYEYLEGEGADVCYYIPERIGEGYGLSMAMMETIIASGIELIITVDNGISALEEIRRAKEAGLEVVDRPPCAAAAATAGRCGPGFCLCAGRFPQPLFVRRCYGLQADLGAGTAGPGR